MPFIRWAVHHQPTAARAKRSTTSPTRTRTAANAGARLPLGRRSCALTITCSGGPRELGRREPGLALVLDPERVDAGALRLGHGQVRCHRVEHAVEPDGLPGLDAERDDVLDL